MNEEFQKRLADYFTGPELLELLEVPVEELVEMLWEPYIQEQRDELEEFMKYGS